MSARSGFRLPYCAMGVLLLSACALGPIHDDVTITIEKNDRVRVTAQTTFNDENLKTAAALEIVERARFDAIHGNDAWSARLGRVTAEEDEVTLHKQRGVLWRVTRSVRIPSSQLQQVFSDTNITVSLLAGEGWQELSLIPGGSTRATREQRRHFEQAIEPWSAALARYYAAIDRMYGYLSLHPHRARILFAAVIDEKPPEHEVWTIAEAEQPLIDSVVAAMEELASRMDRTEDGGTSLREEADLIYNPFPARITVVVPGDVLSREGFGKELVIEPINLFESVGALEGKWISPDPFSMLLRIDEPTAEQLARQPRQSTSSASAHDIANALREQLARPRSYTVRWRE